MEKSVRKNAKRSSWESKNVLLFKSLANPSEPKFYDQMRKKLPRRGICGGRDTVRTEKDENLVKHIRTVIYIRTEHHIIYSIPQ